MTLRYPQQILEEALPLDEDGGANVSGLLKQAQSALTDLKREGASKANQKKAHHRAYMKKRLSICYEEQYLQEQQQEQKETEDDSGSDSSPPNSPPPGGLSIRRNLRYS